MYDSKQTHLALVDTQPLHVIRGQEQMVRTHLARDLQPFLLGRFDKQDLLFPGDVAYVNRPVLKTSHQDHSCRGLALSVDAERCPFGPVAEVFAPHAEVVQAKGGEGFVQVHLQCCGFRCELGDCRCVLGRCAYI